MRRALVLSILVFAPLLVLAAERETSVLVPAGPVKMGGNLVADEKPVHTVEVAAFRMDRCEVTNGEYARFIEAKGYETERFWSKAGWAWLEEKGFTTPKDWEERKKALGEAFPKHPVVGVSFHEAEAYARFAKKRLPTEIEWEKAARGSDGRTYPWGEEVKDGGPVGDSATHTYPVGSNAKDRSPYGILDMGGNVAEWTSTWFGPYPGSTQASRNFGEKYRVIRGGSWRYDVPEKRRCAWRGYWRYGRPDTRGPFIGIRLVSDAKGGD